MEWIVPLYLDLDIKPDPRLLCDRYLPIDGDISYECSFGCRTRMRGPRSFVPKMSLFLDQMAKRPSCLLLVGGLDMLCCCSRRQMTALKKLGVISLTEERETLGLSIHLRVSSRPDDILRRELVTCRDTSPTLLQNPRAESITCDGKTLSIESNAQLTIHPSFQPTRPSPSFRSNNYDSTSRVPFYSSAKNPKPTSPVPIHNIPRQSPT